MRSNRQTWNRTMLVGVMSDSHGDGEITAQAVALLKSRGCEALFHCGDVCSTSVLDALAGERAWFVWGNCDHAFMEWRPYVQSIGLAWPEAPVRVELAGRTILVAHGHERGFDEYSRRRGVDFLFFGHTHRYEQFRDGSVVCVNPGALHRARVKTVAVVNLETAGVLFLTPDGRLIS